MQRFLFQYLELFSFIGDGTRENPGFDFEIACWIDAHDRDAAFDWVRVLLGDYFKMRFEFTPSREDFQGQPMDGGSIIEDEAELARAASWKIPACVVGEIPKWIDPWRPSNHG